MSTVESARKLGLIETIMVDKNRTNRYSIQPFNFLFVLDFEATCWEASDCNRSPPEIIEFSVVLHDVILNRTVAEFQQYVMPMEMCNLSEFCRKLTGISQQQVNNGVPLSTCLMLFTKWISEQVNKFNLVFPGSSTYAQTKKAIFVTWSDWDLNICLQNECKRKRIKKPEFFNMWIDLRALYKEHYSRRPKGLNGALMEVGLNFEGKEHCGLHDARNTALLAGRMINDGVLLRMTKDISPSFNFEN